MTRIRFSSWAQTAAGRAITTTDRDGPLPAATLTPGLSLIRPDGTAVALDAPSAVRMLGPDAVAGLDNRAVVRMDPPPGAGEVEDNYLACVELRPVELPWMFTPARPDDGQNRLRPWIVLVVVETARSRLGTDGPVPVRDHETEQALTPKSELR